MSWAPQMLWIPHFQIVVPWHRLQLESCQCETILLCFWILSKHGWVDWCIVSKFKFSIRRIDLISISLSLSLFLSLSLSLMASSFEFVLFTLLQPHIVVKCKFVSIFVIEKMYPLHPLAYVVHLFLELSLGPFTQTCLFNLSSCT